MYVVYKYGPLLTQVIPGSWLMPIRAMEDGHQPGMGKQDPYIKKS